MSQPPEDTGTGAPGATRLLGRGSFPETARIAEILRAETVGGAILLTAAVVALVWANSPWSDVYVDLRDATIGPAFLHLDLSLATWAADGLLAIFFFVAGLELKREFVSGDLRDPRRAAVPVAAAIGGVVVPALLYGALNLSGDGDLSGWAVPTATDIAFALAVLAVVGSRLPPALRTFLLTLAVVDDLIAITIIALFYSDALHLLPLVGALAVLAVFAILVQRRITLPYLVVPLALACWVLVHESGVHATVAGVLLALVVPVPHQDEDGEDIHGVGLAEHLEYLLRPVSAGIAVPVFAFFSAGVAIGGLSGLGSSLTDRVALGVVVGLVVGKLLGVLGATWLVARFTHATLDDDLAWSDVVALSALSGVGFTVSLLIGELAFKGQARVDDVKVAVLVGSLCAAALAAVLLRRRGRVYDAIAAREQGPTA